MPLQECYLENDQTSLYHTAKGLINLQALYGTIPQIYGKGECARVSVKWVEPFGDGGLAVAALVASVLLCLSSACS